MFRSKPQLGHQFQAFGCRVRLENMDSNFAIKLDEMKKVIDCCHSPTTTTTPTTKQP